MTTTVTAQNIDDVMRILEKTDYLQEQKIKICIAFGSLLAQQNFNEPTDYYIFLTEFEKYIESNLI